MGRHAPGVRLVAGDLLASFARCERSTSSCRIRRTCTEGELAGLAPEVRDFEPRLALAAGADGLDVLRALVAAGSRVLAAGGWMLVEVGAGQAGAVRDLFAADGRYTSIVVERDHAGIARVVGARKRGVGTWTAS